MIIQFPSRSFSIIKYDALKLVTYKTMSNPYRISVFSFPTCSATVNWAGHVRSTWLALPSCNTHHLIPNEPTWDINLRSLTASQRTAVRVVEMIFLWIACLWSPPFNSTHKTDYREFSNNISINIHMWRWLLTVIDWIWMTEEKCRVCRKEKKVSPRKVITSIFEST